MEPALDLDCGEFADVASLLLDGAAAFHAVPTAQHQQADSWGDADDLHGFPPVNGLGPPELPRSLRPSRAPIAALVSVCFAPAVLQLRRRAKAKTRMAVKAIPPMPTAMSRAPKPSLARRRGIDSGAVAVATANPASAGGALTVALVGVDSAPASR